MVMQTPASNSGVKLRMKGIAEIPIDLLDENSGIFRITRYDPRTGLVAQSSLKSLYNDYLDIYRQQAKDPSLDYLSYIRLVREKIQDEIWTLENR